VEHRRELELLGGGMLEDLETDFAHTSIIRRKSN
jgi:hypothetical protein